MRVCLASTSPARLMLMRQAGIEPTLLGDALEGEARDMGTVLAGVARYAAKAPSPRHRVLLSYEPLWEEKEINIDLALEATQIYGSKSLLAQVWSNLIDNAIKFSKPGGMLSIGCRELEGFVIVRIKDTGIGMSEEVRLHACDKFYQGEHSHTTQGNGLGLALVWRIVTLCGGTIEIRSKEGKGTEILVTLKSALPPAV